MEHIEGALTEHGDTFEDIEVDCCNFNALMEQHDISRIDYLSIDVEGAELKILESIDFDAVKIAVISTENNYADERIKELLSSRGYGFYKRVGKDDFYRWADNN